MAEYTEQSIQLIDGLPSSPFLSEVASNRSPSRQTNLLDNSFCNDDQYSSAHVDNSSKRASYKEEEKENVPITSKRSSTNSSPARRHLQNDGDSNTASKISIDTDLMPPPSISRTPKRSPFKSTQSARPSSRSSPRQELSDSHSQPSTALARLQLQSKQDSSNVDDTCFSTFSEVPDLTSWSKASHTFPTRPEPESRTPRSSRKRASPSRSPSPTPRRLKNGSSQENTQSFLIDFTNQMEAVSGLPSSRTEPDLLQHLNRQRSPGKNFPRQSLATPAKQSNILNLLDFELPPAPTPRSIPTITVRELETLKSQYLGQISNLRATLNGREAEVESLKRAVADAERRVGDAQESLREERCRREQAEQEKLDWEKRGIDIENVLKEVKEEVLKGEIEKDDLLQRLDENEKRADEAEAKAIKLEDALEQALTTTKHTTSNEDGSTNIHEQVQQLVAAQIDAKIEAVSRELHSVYKEKHERKVATLKKSYEARNEKRCAELLSKVSKLEKAHDEILLAKETLAAGLEASPSRRQNAVDGELRAQMEQQKAHLARIEEELTTSRTQRDELVQALEQERIEKGDLVAAVDEMLALQADQAPVKQAISVVEDFRKSISRPPSSMTGMRMPSGGESKIGRMIPQPGRTPAGSKSRMLANIERMGRSVSHE